MLKPEHQPTPRNGLSGQISQQEILQKLMKKNSKSRINAGEVVNGLNSQEKYISKSPSSGWHCNGNQSSDKGSHKVRHQSNEDVQKTAKKPKHISHISQNNRDWAEKNNETQNNFIQNANVFLREKTLENKLDKLCQQVGELKRKSEKLEQQNKLLFDNLKKFQSDRETHQERNTLLQRLDQMIEMQQRQEENLTCFKQLFTAQDESRRIKTQQSQPKQRTFGKSAYMGFNIENQ